MRMTMLGALVLPLTLLACSAPANQPAASARAQLKDPGVLFDRGKAYADAGDFTRAEQYFSASIAAGGESGKIMPHLLKACVASGDIRLASEYAETELSKNPRQARLRFLAGALRASLGERSAAREHLVTAASEMPRDPEVQFSVGAFFRDDVGDKVAADPYFRKYLEIAPKGAHADEARSSIMGRLR